MFRIRHPILRRYFVSREGLPGIRFKKRVTFLVFVAAILVCLDFSGKGPEWIFGRRRGLSTRRIPVDTDTAQALESSFRFEKPVLPWHPRGVLYRGAPWRPAIGQWLRRCREPIIETVTEVFHSRPCPGGCSDSQGVCNAELGQCRCRHGYNGSDCSGLDDVPCNLPPEPNFPLGGHTFAICAGTCDHRLAHCLCGERSPYPNRPVIDPCGFRLAESGWPLHGEVDLEQLYGTDPIRPGWCMVDPAKFGTGEQKLERVCYNNYDGWEGVFSDIPVQSYCILQCSGPHSGVCDKGFCKCQAGWYGAGCSTPTAEAVQQGSWLPPWLAASVLRPAQAEPLEEDLPPFAASTHVLEAKRNARRPLIYVYDLPPKFNGHLIEGRQNKRHCAVRLYSQDNATDFNGSWMYGSEGLLHEEFLSSPHRTGNPEEADYFFVPLLGACLMALADQSPRINLGLHAETPELRVRPSMMVDWALEVYHHLRTAYPFWNRTDGRDHIWPFLFDEGACYAPQAIWNSIMLTHWGNTGRPHAGNTTAYLGDVWAVVPAHKRGPHPCYDPLKDIVVPARKTPDFIVHGQHRRPFEERPHLFFFRGNLGSAYEIGRPEGHYSLGIRQRVAHFFASAKSKAGSVGVRSEPDVVVENLGVESYAEQLSRARFCGVFPGDGFSARMEDAVLQGCIPVIIQDGIELPFENVLDYESFAVRIAEEDIPNMVSILRGIQEDRVRRMLQAVQSLAARWFFRSAHTLIALQEAERAGDGKLPLWAPPLHLLEGEDDAFDTVIQVLWFKLRHDEWRRHFPQKAANRRATRDC